MERIDLLVKSVAVAAAGFWGGLIPMVQLLLLIMALDVLSGVMVAGAQGQLSSKVSFVGISRKVLALLLVALAAAIAAQVPEVLRPELTLGGLNVVVSLDAAVAGFYCYHEGLSVLENATEAKLPVPGFLKEALAKLTPEPKPRPEG